MCELLLEETSYKKKYKCPYCDIRLEREALINHINKKHEDLIPEGYSASRLVFNLVNKKDHGSCIICRKETKWDEDKERYDRICEMKSCHEAYVKMVDERITKMHGMPKLTADPEFQNKMLQGRSISGKYKFSSGGVLDYVGSYEKKFCEFMDLVMKTKTEDWLAPGPVIEYEFNGEKHFWITDYMYIPYSLVFDIKDGGSNPNTRDMKEYREKQKAKEDAIKKLNQYSYVRLTDNQFNQAMSAMIELKLRLQDSNSNPIFHINESTPLAGINFMPGTKFAPGTKEGSSIYMIPYMQNNVFAGIAVGRNRAIGNGVTIGYDGKVKPIDLKEFLDENTQYSLYEYTGDDALDKYKSLLLDAKYEVLRDKFYPYELLAEHRILLDLSEIQESTVLKKCISDQEYSDIYVECLIETMIKEGEYEMIYEEAILEGYMGTYQNIEMKRDENGDIYIKNKHTGLKSKSYKSVADIPRHVLEIINRE